MTLLWTIYLARFRDYNKVVSFSFKILLTYGIGTSYTKGNLAYNI